MICTCDKCLYTFYAWSRPETCPDCGAPAIRDATPEEEDGYYDLEIEKLVNPLLLDKVS